MARLNKKFIEQLQNSAASTGKEIICFDDDLQGFGIRVKPSGRTIWITQYRNKAGESRRAKVGIYGVLGPDEARREAKKLLAQAAIGADPAAEKRAAQQAQTMNVFLDEFLTRHVSRRKERSVTEYRRLIEQHIRPALGALKVHAVRPKDVIDLHHKLQKTPYQANRVLAVLSKSMNLAELWGLRPGNSNPCRHIEKYPEPKRQRFLSTHELAALGKALANEERAGNISPHPIAAIRLLTFTGARLMEILTCRWEYVDIPNASLRLPDSKTGAKIIHLPAPALDILSTLPRVEGNPFVIIGHKAGRHLVNTEKPWRRIRDAAIIELWRTDANPAVSGLIERVISSGSGRLTLHECRRAAKAAGVGLPVGMSDVRLHDLRHSFASVAAASGMSLTIIGALLGQSQPATTARYAHLAPNPKQQAVEAIGARIEAALTGRDEKVVTLTRR